MNAKNKLHLVINSIALLIFVTIATLCKSTISHGASPEAEWIYWLISIVVASAISLVSGIALGIGAEMYGSFLIPNWTRKQATIYLAIVLTLLTTMVSALQSADKGTSFFYEFGAVLVAYSLVQGSIMLLLGIGKVVKNKIAPFEHFEPA